MKLRSSKALYAGVGMVMCLMPVLPNVVVDAQTTYEQQQSTNIEKNIIQASYTENVSDIVATGYEGNNETKEAGAFANQAISITDPYLAVYALNDMNSAEVGRLYENTLVDTLEVGKEWTKISSGNVIGFVKTSTLCFGDEAARIAEEQGEDFEFSAAYTVEEAEAKEEAERIAAEEAEAARLAEEAAAASVQVTYNSGMSASANEVQLLACIIDWESGWESYEGKLAVANVVLNRVRNGNYGNSITSVIYAPNQFSGVSDGSGNASSTFAARLASGPRTGECTQAALDALAGVNNVGSYTSFRSLAIANYSAYSSYMVIGNHVFF